jgi:Flp pilus assembly protein TadG
MKKINSMSKRHCSARRNSLGKRGEGLVEFAIVLPLFFLLIFGILDMGHLYFVQVTIENAVRQAGRFAVTGQKLPGQPSRVASIQQVARNAAPGLDLTAIVISSSSGSATGGVGNVDSAGLPGEDVTISLKTHLTLFTNLMGHYYGTNDVDTFSESVTFRNERFPYSWYNQ